MSLIDICEPIFLDLSAINSSAGDGSGNLAFVPVRLRIQNTLAAIQHSAQNLGEGENFSKIHLPLLCFVDWMLSQYTIPLSAQWAKQPLAPASGDTSKGQIFFDALKQAIDDPSPAAEDRVEVLYTCLAFGYEGIYAGDAAGLSNVITDAGNRIRSRLQTDESICPDAYAYTDRRALHLSVVGPLTMIGIGCAFLLLVAFLFNGVLYLDRTKSLTDFLK
jgi:type IV/VI secretion system ImpK/VasF family protein